MERIDLCPMMETKSFCSVCRIHCYQKEMREQIHRVMRYAGPRMLLYHPFITIQHGMTAIFYRYYKERLK